MVTRLLYLFSTDGATTLAQLCPYAPLLKPTMWHFSWQKPLCLDVTVVFVIYGKTSL